MVLSLELISWGCKSSASPLKEKVALKFKVQSLSAPSHSLLIPRNPKLMRCYLQPRLTVKTRCMLTLLARSWISFQTSLGSWDFWTRCLEPFYIYFQLFFKVSSQILQLPQAPEMFCGLYPTLDQHNGSKRRLNLDFMWTCPLETFSNFQHCKTSHDLSENANFPHYKKTK